MQNQYFDKVYKEICSEKTLQSNSQGFFMTFVEQVVEGVGKEWIKNVFGKLQSDKQRLRTVYDDEKISSVITSVLSNVQEVYRKKDPKFSHAKLLEAGVNFQNGNVQKAIMLYSQSILRAPSTEQNVEHRLVLPLALWGRSAVFLKTNKFLNAVSDIQMALKEKLPESFKAEAYWKIGLCYKALNDENRSKVAFSVAQKLLKDEKQQLELQNDMKKNIIVNHEQTKKVLPNISNAHKKYPYASKKISVKMSKDLGRYVVANEEITTGENIVVEPPYVACLLPEVFGTHCQNCFERLVSAIGCPICCGVAFCSANCRDTALRSYHKYECKFLDLLIGSGMSVLAHAALRMVTQNEFDKTMDIYKNREKERIYSLCTNSNLRSPEDFFQRTLMVTFLLRILQKSGYFPSRKDDTVIPTEEELCIAEMLLFNLQMLQFNAHEIFETLCTPNHRYKHSKTLYIGVAVYPTVSLFNHDCYPAVSRHFVGKNIVIRALRLLKIDDVIAENYGPIFTRRVLPERRRSLLSRYWFICKCDACTLDWPTLDTGLEKVSKRIRCPTKGCENIFCLPLSNETVNCPKCNENVPLKERILKLNWCEEQFNLGFEAMDTMKTDKAVNILCAALDTFHRISCPPHKDTHLAEEMLRACLADSGNVYDVLEKKENM